MGKHNPMDDNGIVAAPPGECTGGLDCADSPESNTSAVRERDWGRAHIAMCVTLPRTRYAAYDLVTATFGFTLA